MTWLEAAIEALKLSGHPLTVVKILDQIQSQSLHAITGKTPEATVGAALYTAIQSGDPRLKQAGPAQFEYTGVVVDSATIKNIGRLEFIPVTEVWPHEANDFTPWLLENSDELGIALGIEIELESRERQVGKFSLDLFGRDATNDCPLAIENQLYKTDHSHLGQLLTYAAGTDALTAIWISSEFRDEHREALEYLNNLANGSARFFGIELKVGKIGNSEPAPIFDLVVQPSNWRTKIKTDRAKNSEGGQEYRAFWEKYLEKLHSEYPGLTKARVPASRFAMNIVSLGRGVKLFGAQLSGEILSCEVYIDTGEHDPNLAIFNALHEQKESIEKIIGAKLQWEELSNRRACRIRLTCDGQIRDLKQQEKLVNWLLKYQVKFYEAFGPAVRNLDKSMWETSQDQDLEED